MLSPHEKRRVPKEPSVVSTSTVYLPTAISRICLPLNRGLGISNGVGELLVVALIPKNDPFPNEYNSPPEVRTTENPGPAAILEIEVLLKNGISTGYGYDVMFPIPN
jgi:hypothetical protein